MKNIINNIKDYFSTYSNGTIYKEMLSREKLPLPYSYFEEDYGIYVLDNDSFALIFECIPLGGFSAEAGLNTLLSILPSDAAIQFLLLPSKNITQALDNWKIKKSKYENISTDINKEIYEITRDNYASFLENKTKEQVSSNMPLSITDYRLIVSISIGSNSINLLDSLINTFSQIFYDSINSLSSFKKDKDNNKEYKTNTDIYKNNMDYINNIPSMNSLTIDHINYNKDDNLSIEDNLYNRFRVLVANKKRIESALTSANLYPRILTPNRLIENLFVMLNPKHDFRAIPNSYNNSFDQLNSLSENIIANDNVIEVHKDYIVFDDTYGKSLSVKDFPNMWHCSLSELLIGSAFGDSSIDSSTYICLNVINLGQKGIRDTKNRAKLILNHKANPAMFPRVHLKKQDLARANYELEQGEQIFHANFSIFVTGKNFEEMEHNISQVKAYYQTLGFILEEDKYINLPVLLSMLPGNYDVAFKKDLARGKHLFQKNIVDLAPTMTDWKGNTNDAEVFFLTPRGQLFSFDIFASDTNYNALCVGTSGAGKSVLLQYIAMNYIMSGTRICIIDIGGSYENFCGILNGQYIDIRRDKPISLNPFTTLLDKNSFIEFKEFLCDFYWLLGSPESQSLSQELSKLIKAYLNNALDLTYELHGPDSDVDTLIEAFKEIVSVKNEKDEKVILDNRVSDFIHILSQYGKKGMYGDFFNYKSNINFKSDLVVLEIGSMENIAELRDPILMILTYHISKSIYSNKDMFRRNIILIDEAHKFLGNPKTDSFIEQAYRRFRKHNASMIIGTQGWEDLDSDITPSRAGRVIIENSAYQIIMAQSSASAEKLKKSKSHNFNDYDKQMIDSIRPIKGEYSEALIINGQNKVKVRTVLDSWMQKIFFTTPAMRRFIKEEINNGKSFYEAINNVPKDVVI